MESVTQMLNGIGQDSGAADDLLATIYVELRRMAASKMAREQPGHTLQATALVNEMWLKLSALDGLKWKNRRHFFGAAAEVMRRILVEKARSRNSQKRGGGAEKLPLDEANVAAPVDDDKLLLVHEALERLDAHDSEKAEIVKLRFFVGLTYQEIASLLGVSEKTVKRHWAYSKAWLYDVIDRDQKQ
jgi:RNA polymerase sigma factor (TIGR02999 family)